MIGRIATLLVGLVGFIFSLAAVFGTIPITGAVSGVAPSYTVNVSNLKVTLTDTTSCPGLTYCEVVSEAVAWDLNITNDSYENYTAPVGAPTYHSFSHTYPTGGKKWIELTAYLLTCSNCTAIATAADGYVNASNNTNTTVSGPMHGPEFNAVTGLMAVGFGAMLVTSLAPKAPLVAILGISGLGAAIGFGLGLLAGGLGPLQGV